MRCANTVLLDYEKGTIRSKLDSGKFGDARGGLGDHLGRWNALALRPHHSLQTRLFGRRANVTAALDELPLEGVVDGGMGGDGIVG